VLTGAMFRQQAKPRGGVAEISSDGEKLSVTTCVNKLCGFSFPKSINQNYEKQLRTPWH